MSRTARPQSSNLARRPLATPQDVAEYCGVPLNTVYRWSSRGGGPKFIKVGKRLRARWDDVEAWLDSQTITA
ncbi:helix-turn-helix transcriptional regulator [Streptomyces chartreusis]|uniref:helix-turn-helix transcriptional regulator n=1 Tax=Streptomyces chartreusis TaxID=1969 RepID=UPI0033D7C51A